MYVFLLNKWVQIRTLLCLYAIISFIVSSDPTYSDGQKILGKLVNPIFTVVFTLLDGQGEEIARLIDPRKSIPDRLLGLGPTSGPW